MDKCMDSPCVVFIAYIHTHATHLYKHTLNNTAPRIPLRWWRFSRSWASTSPSPSSSRGSRSSTTAPPSCSTGTKPIACVPAHPSTRQPIYHLTLPFNIISGVSLFSSTYHLKHTHTHTPSIFSLMVLQKEESALPSGVETMEHALILTLGGPAIGVFVGAATSYVRRV